MRLDLDPRTIQAGLQQRRELETPSGSIQTVNNASENRANTRLDQSSRRMAGPMGARAIQLMNDPNEQVRTQNWVSRFARTPMGMQFFGAPTIG
jgi:hypothetical protein